MDFFDTFKTKNSQRDKYLSRIFGIFSEDIIRIWCKQNIYGYRDLGRPTIQKIGDDAKKYTLDFTLINDGKIFVAEMKCELEYQKYKFLELESIDQLGHHKRDKPAFNAFLDLAKDPKNYQVKVNGEEVHVDGAILIWGKVSNKGKEEVCIIEKIFDILSVEEVINQMIRSDSNYFNSFIAEKKEWSDFLFQKLLQS